MQSSELRIKWGEMMRRLTMISAISAIALICFSTSATAEEGDGSNAVPVKTSRLFKATKKTGEISIRSTAAKDDVPPSGGCWGQTSFSTTATYINGLLAETDTPYQGSVSCQVSNSAETMAFLQADVGMYINGNQRQPDAAPSSCQRFQPSDPVCTATVSAGRAECFISERCDGYYGSANTFDMLLPEGWVYTSYPSECTLIAPQEVSCLVKTDLVEIPPVS